MSTDNKDVMNGILGKIFTVLSQPDGVNENIKKSEEPWISYTQPGISISEKDFHFGDLQTKEEFRNQAQFSLLVDVIPNVSGFWSDSGKKVSNVYRDAITNVVLPKVELTKEQEVMLEKANNYLMVTKQEKNPFTDEVKTTKCESDYVKAYRTYKAKYQTMLMTYNNLNISAKAANATPEDIEKFNRNGPIARQNVIDAYTEWESEGNKGYVEQARGIIGNITGTGLDKRYQELRSNYEMLTRLDPDLGNYSSTFYYPLNIFDEGELSWTTASFTEQNVSEFSNMNSKSWGGGVTGSYGLFSASADVKYGSKTEQFSCDTKGLDITVDLVQLPISRPWMDASIFESHSWKWSQAISECISNGEDLPSGMMPILPTSIILARNLEIKMDVSSEENKFAMSKLEVSASAGWGPFSIKGNYSSEQSESSHIFEKTSNGIKCKGMQIIGFICDRLPKCPDTSPNINFPD